MRGFRNEENTADFDRAAGHDVIVRLKSRAQNRLPPGKVVSARPAS